MKKLVYLWAFIAVCVASFSSCADDNESPKLPDNERVRAVIASQGNYGHATASLSAIMYDGSIQNDVFSKKNGRPLGDIAQGAALIDGKLFVSLNNSNKIEVMDSKSFESIQTILFDEAVSPHYIVPISDHEAVVSDLFSSDIHLIDTKTLQLTGKIDVKGNGSKQMVVAEGKLFVAAGGQIQIIDLQSRTWRAAVEGGAAAAGDSKIVTDQNGNIWCIASEGLFCINPKDNKVSRQLALPEGVRISSFGVRLDINTARNKLYFTATKDKKSGIYEVDIQATQIPANPIFVYSHQVKELYCMGVSPQGTILICDALDYTQRGLVFEYKLDGTLANKGTVGIIPGYILFTNE